MDRTADNHDAWKASLAVALEDCRQRTHALLVDLPGSAWLGPELPIVNAPRWEVGHVGWFLEHFVLRHGLGHKPMRADADGFWDSVTIPHAARWQVPMPEAEEACAYLDAVHERVQDELASDRPEVRSLQFLQTVQLALFHGDMHNEAFVYTWQTHGYPAPKFVQKAWQEGAPEEDTDCQDVRFAGGEARIGAERGEPFCFDNESWAHTVTFDAFAISALPVTAGEFVAFVEADGYRRPELWSEAGLAWCRSTAASQPVYWRQADGRWQRRLFDTWIPLTLDLPMLHVNYHEAEAWCRFAGRRLPTEIEWEIAAGSTPEGRRIRPWGEDQDASLRANLDWNRGGVVGVHAFPRGDTAGGCRQMLGNVWEWTSSTFEPYPGFAPGVYGEYSQPWFDTRKVLRGGAWCSMSRMLNNRCRNFFEPERNDIWAGFRTCALRS